MFILYNKQYVTNVSKGMEMNNAIVPSKNDVVRKSDFLVKARYKLNPLALKFITLVIANVRKSDEPDREYIFRVKDFMELSGMDYKQLYNYLDEATDELLKSPLKIPKEKGFLKLNWVSSVEYHAGKGCISFKVDSKLRPYIFDLQERFLKYRIENILRLRSGYVIRLYEILKDWYNQSERYNGSKKVEKIVEVRWLRKILEMPDSYPYGGSSGVRNRVIEKAKKELTEHTDIKFDYKEIKTGRKVTHLKFIIEENPKNAKEDDKASDYSFLKSKKAFISYLRKHYVNKPIIEAPNKNFDGQMSKWSISQNGLIYDMYLTEENINATRSDEIYEKLYEFAKKNEQFKEKLANKE